MTKLIAAGLAALQSLYQVDRFEPGDPIVAGDLIEDDDAPLPHELQQGGAVWDAVVGVLYRHESRPTAERQADVAADILRALAPTEAVTRTPS